MSGHTVAAYMRVASIAIAGYDGIRTCQKVWRIYEEQWRLRRLTLSTSFLLLIRITSVLLLIFSNYGFFSKFTEQKCSRYFVMSSIFKVIQMAVSQAILGVRAWNLSRRSRNMGVALGLLYLVCVTFQSLMTLVGRVPHLNKEHLNCLPATRNGQKTFLGGAPSYYPVAIAYDLTVTAICVYYLVKYKLNNRAINSSSMVVNVANMMLLDGLVYFLALTAINVVNLVFYYTITETELQTAAASPSYTFMWIMSQNLLLHLHDASVKRRMHSVAQERGSTYPETSSEKAPASDSRRGYDSKSRYEFTVPTPSGGEEYSDTTQSYPRRGPATQILSCPEPSVRVTVERKVTVARNERAYRLENYAQARREGVRTTVMSGQDEEESSMFSSTNVGTSQEPSDHSRLGVSSGMGRRSRDDHRRPRPPSTLAESPPHSFMLSKLP
ncbi:hypothetical protein BDV98DRAFT_38249 [Pterulicium gracile]|uniref:Uncharacterized protein n=1 Tax=Pterulicium gracile TaxID=1884261 RepID=A0A5C3R8K5_9AGAR|nr:hypothetical protein BDV98DRAFT_38249 [Pterula gracilis]